MKIRIAYKNKKTGIVAHGKDFEMTKKEYQELYKITKEMNVDHPEFDHWVEQEDGVIVTGGDARHFP